MYDGMKAEAPNATGKPNRNPVMFRFDGLNWDFIKLLAEIAHYADNKYGSCEQYSTGTLDKEKSPVNHIAEHLRQYVTGAPHDHFGDRIYHLAAIAYNAMMEALYLRRFGRLPSTLNLQYAKQGTNATIQARAVDEIKIGQPVTFLKSPEIKEYSGGADDVMGPEPLFCRNENCIFCGPERRKRELEKEKAEMAAKLNAVKAAEATAKSIRVDGPESDSAAYRRGKEAANLLLELLGLTMAPKR